MMIEEDQGWLPSAPLDSIGNITITNNDINRHIAISLTINHQPSTININHKPNTIRTGSQADLQDILV